MAKCAHCGKFIIGGKKQGNLRFCNDACYQKGFLAAVAERAAPEVVQARVKQLREQACPVCGGDGPVDIHTSHTAWSLIVITSWKDRPRLSCSRCGRAAILRGIAFTALLGWWGFPFGIVVTPWQLLNGWKSLSKTGDTSQPSEELQQMAKMEVATTVQANQAS